MKKTVFELESEIYASLAHPKRLEILHLLSHKSLTVSQIVEMTGLSQAGVSQHLMTLKKLLLVRCEKCSQQRVYSLSSPRIRQLLKSARALLVTSHVLPEIFIDPVCGMEVTATSAASSLTVHGNHYYFCALGCEKKFKKMHSIPVKNGNQKEAYV